MIVRQKDIQGGKNEEEDERIKEEEYLGLGKGLSVTTLQRVVVASCGPSTK